MDPLVLALIVAAALITLLWLLARGAPRRAGRRRPARRDSRRRTARPEVSYRVSIALPVTALPGDVDRDSLRGLRALLASVELADRLRLQVDHVDEIIVFVTVMATGGALAENRARKRLRLAGLAAMHVVARRELRS